jgi:hypothetical protein
MRNLKRMYNNVAGSREETGNKTSIRNKKNRISQEVGGKRGSETGSRINQIKRESVDQDSLQMHRVTKSMGLGVTKPG